MCELANGPAPDEDMHAAHSCGNGRSGCVNPMHLRWATVVQNAEDRDVHQRTFRGSVHHFSKLSEETVLAIYACRTGLRLGEAQARFGVSKGAISGIWSGKNWAWLTGANGGRGTRRAA
ncbi:hypothetical protein [Bradyrhizobium elkanii]